MVPVVRVAEMQAADAAAREPVSVLIERAGAAVARAAVDMMGGAYGRRVVVVAGSGNNGADGRVAARRLRERGAGVVIVPAGPSAVVPACDLVIDAAVGTGMSRSYDAPDAGGASVLAVDVPSGIDADTGLARGRAVRADRTVTFAALKPGLLLADGPAHAGEVDVVDVGIDVSGSQISLMDDASAAALLPVRDRSAHKWSRSVLVVAGSPGMQGAAGLVCEAALRSGCGMVRLISPGTVGSSAIPREAVVLIADESAWADVAVDEARRVGAAAVGPGLGLSMVARHEIRSAVGSLSVPLVVDGDGLTALGPDAAEILHGRRAATVVTPHDGEFERLSGRRPGPDRIADTMALARALGAVVLLKGPTTVLAEPGGRVVLVDSGDERLATAGTGDVLTGLVSSFLAAGLPALDAAALAAHVHGRTVDVLPRSGVIASDVVGAVPTVLAMLRPDGTGAR